MTSFLSNVLGSIFFRLILIFGGFTTLIGAVIVVSWMVFSTTTDHMEKFSGQKLPLLKEATNIVRKTDRTRELLSEVLAASTLSELEAFETNKKVVLGDLLQSMASLPEAEAANLGEMLSEVRKSLNSLLVLRKAEFSADQELAQKILEAKSLAVEANTLLSATSEQAYETLVSRGDWTVSTIDSTLRQVIERDFSLYEAALTLRAEMNLLTGLSLTLAEEPEFQVLQTVSEWVKQVDARMDVLVERLREQPATRKLAQTVADASAQMSGYTGEGAAFLSTAEILKISTKVDESIIEALEKIDADITRNATSALDLNKNSIEGLLDQQVAELREKANVALATQSFISEVLEIALVKDNAELATQQEVLDTAKKALDEAALADASGAGISASDPSAYQGSEETKKIKELLQELKTLADPETGIGATRAASLNARQQGEIAETAATKAVDQIADKVNLFATTLQQEIISTADMIAGEVEGATARVQTIGMLSVAFVVASPLLVWLMVTRPLNLVTLTTERLARGELHEIKGLLKKKGEIGRLSRALEVFRTNALDRIKLQEEEKRRETEAFEAERQAERAQREARERARLEQAEREEEARRKEAEEARRLEEVREAAEAERRAQAEEQKLVVDALAQGLKRLSSGDLGHRIQDRFPGDYEALRADFNDAIDSLAELITRIGQSAGTIDGSSSEILSSSLDLSKRTESAAATLQETAAALNQLTASVTSAARGANEANQTVETVKSDAETSQKVMQEAVTAMSEIEESSSKISKIVEVIDGIAFQTNLLALNAGVEAARAGKAGRGFAVVASEVRVLAQRCSEAATEINGLITGATTQVDRGVALIDKTNAALGTIATGIVDISQHVTQIANSSTEQSSGISEINNAIADLDQSTQQNAAMFEETTAASQALTDQAGELSRMIAGFTVTAERNESPEMQDWHAA